MQFLVSMDLQLNGAAGAQLAIIDRASRIYSLFAAHTLFQSPITCVDCVFLFI